MGGGVRVARARRGVGPLGLDDLERLVWSAALTGHDEAFLGGLERLHKAAVGAGECRRAARAAFWIGFFLSTLGGASSAAEGWFAGASRLLENEPPCAERGYLVLAGVYRHLAAGNDAAAAEAAGDAAHVGERCGDPDLVALARNLEARALLLRGLVEKGLGLLDELMVLVTSGDLSPLVTGIPARSAF